MSVRRSMSRSDCSFLRRFAPAYADAAEDACDAHDKRYHNREGSRLAADLAWIGQAAALTQRPWLTLFFGAWLIAFGWWLWYDLDTRLGLN